MVAYGGYFLHKREERDMTIKEFLARYDEGEDFDEYELKDIFWLDFDQEDDDTCTLIESEYDEPRRWQRNHTKYVEINGRYFELNADEALTELQDTQYWCQPQEVSFKQETKIITVVENIWTPIERKKI